MSHLSASKRHRNSGLDSKDDKFNVLGPEPLAELDALAGQIAENTDIVGIILHSNKPGGFVAGADIGLIESVTDAVVGETPAARPTGFLQVDAA